MPVLRLLCLNLLYGIRSIFYVLVSGKGQCKVGFSPSLLSRFFSSSFFSFGRTARKRKSPSNVILGEKKGGFVAHNMDMYEIFEQASSVLKSFPQTLLVLSG